MTTITYMAGGKKVDREEYAKQRFLILNIYGSVIEFISNRSHAEVEINVMSQAQYDDWMEKGEAK